MLVRDRALVRLPPLAARSCSSWDGPGSCHKGEPRCPRFRILSSPSSLPLPRPLAGSPHDATPPELASQSQRPELAVLTGGLPAPRPDGSLLPLPGSLRGGAATKVVGALLTRGLAREEVTDSSRLSDKVLNIAWRNEEDGRAVMLRITAAGLGALGIEPPAGPEPGTPQRLGDGGTDSSSSAESPRAREAAKAPQRVTQRRCGARPARAPTRRR